MTDRTERYVVHEDSAGRSQGQVLEASSALDAALSFTERHFTGDDDAVTRLHVRCCDDGRSYCFTIDLRGGRIAECG